MAFLDSRSFFVHGMGKSGTAVARLLAGRGYDVFVYDDDWHAVEASKVEIGGNVTAVSPTDGKRALDGCDRLVISPGVPLDHPLVVYARKTGKPVESEIEAAFHFVDARIVGVTGTNGKSTTVGVIGAILTAGGFRVTVAGNVGTPFSDVVDEPCDVFVLELSSFQLDTIDRFRVDVAVLLNVTPDHLDRYHHSFDEYAASKKRILNRSGVDTWLVYNEDDRVCTETAAGFDGHKLGFSSTTRLEQGMCLEDGAIVLAWGSDRQRVVERSEFTPIGIHNAENAMAAIGAATAFGVEPDAIRSALRGYRALPHRMELVRVVAGVGYVNDSKATNVDATVKSLRSIEGGVVLILGGRDKEGDFKALIPHLGNVRKVILIGEAGRVIHAALEGSCDLEDAADMASAVARATASAVPGDTVLLAPACASFDMFDNYQARGQAFRNSVNAISTAKG